MKFPLFTFLLLTWASTCQAQRLASSLAKLPPYSQKKVPADWLLGTQKYPAGIYQSGQDVVLSNGLLQRRIRLTPNAATIDYQNLSTGEQFVRSVRPEARLIIDGQTYAVGGLYGQTEHAYLREEWVAGFTASTSDFQVVDLSVTPLRPYFPWKPTTWTTNPNQPGGQVLTLSFASERPELRGIRVQVHYELYDDIPVLCKWVSVENNRPQAIRVEQIVSEILATPEEESAVVGTPEQMKKPQRLYIESNYAFNNAMRYELSDQATHWKRDSSYTSQVNYYYDTPCLLEIYPSFGMSAEVPPGQVLRSIRTHELLLDSYDRERNGLARRHMYRTVAPWTTQNPMFMHLISNNLMLLIVLR